MYDCNVKGNSHSVEVKVASGEGPHATFRQFSRAFYNKNHYPSEIESLLVRPLAQAIKVYNDTSRMGSFTPHMNILMPKIVVLALKFLGTNQTICPRTMQIHVRL